MASAKGRRKAATQMQSHSARTNLFEGIGVIIAVLAFLLLGIYLSTSVFHVIPDSFSKLIYAAIVGIFVFAILRIFTRVLESRLTKATSQGRARPIVLIVNLIGYFILALFVLSALGINTSSVLLSGTIIGAVVGLASQNVLSNIFGGIMLIFVKPFKVGDRVEISTWQYGVMLTLTPPKYFSRDEVKNGYRGTIEDLTLMYTIIKDRDNEHIKIPNSIMVQAAIAISSTTHTLNIRYEIPKSIQFEKIRSDIEKAVKTASGIKGMPSIIVEETTVLTYLLRISFECKVEIEEEVKSDILQSLISITEPLKQKS